MALLRPAATLTAVAVTLIAAGGASAAQREITPPGPLKSIVIADDTACQAQHAVDTHGEFFAEGSSPGNCGTFIRAGGATYGPAFDNDQGPTVTPYTKVSQSAVAGSGTAADPYRVATVVSVPSLTITELDSYVNGLESYRTDIKISNTSGAPVSATLYHAGDCFIQSDDFGYGWFNSVTGGIYCARNANNFPPARIEGFTPISAGSRYREGEYEPLWMGVEGGAEFPNSCDCTSLLDNGAGLSWSVTVPANGSVTRSLNTVFSPSGDPSGNGRTADPVAGKFFGAKPAGGTVYYKCSGDSKQRRLGEGTNLRVGCAVDARKGKVKIVAAAGAASSGATAAATKTKAAIFYNGQFKVKEKPSSNTLTELVMTGKLVGCSRKSSAGGTAVAARKRGRRLWGKGKGRFRTRGKHSSASVRATKWLVYDRCDGATYTKAASGKVTVRDFVRHKTVTLKKGQSYLARPRRRH